jgi:hypothetical protein
MGSIKTQLEEQSEMPKRILKFASSTQIQTGVRLIFKFDTAPV